MPQERRCKGTCGDVKQNADAIRNREGDAALEFQTEVAFGDLCFVWYWFVRI
jgi:hypothetical protein